MTFLFVFTLILGFYMAWNIGANDVANAMGTSVGSKALTLRRAVIIAAILEFSGAFLVGSTVSETIQQGIVDPKIFSEDPMTFVLGMISALLATGILLQFASYFGLPLSTTHAIVGAVVGFGLAVGGTEAIFWTELSHIAASWIISPLLSGVIAYAMFVWVQKKILFALDPQESTKKLTPYLVFFCFTVVCLSFLFQGLKQLDLNLCFSTALLISCSVGLIGSILSILYVRKKLTFTEAPQIQGLNPYQAVSLEKALHHLTRVHLYNRDPSYQTQIQTALQQVRGLNETVKKKGHFTQSPSQYLGVEKIFTSLQIISASLVAFAHGANDVANAIGPVAAVLGVLRTSSVTASHETPTWLLALGGGGIVIGLATWGWRVIETIGKKITELTPTRGFCAEFGAALTILLASKLGLPISTTHALVGAVFGVGLARGLQALNLQTLKEIVVSWIVTIPLCALFSVAVFYTLNYFLH
jgi:PiT family inorganic phosphate transporter